MLEKSGAHDSWKGERVGQGRETACQWMAENPKVASDGQLRCLPDLPVTDLNPDPPPGCRADDVLVERGCQPAALVQTRVPGCPARFGVRKLVPVDNLFLRRWGGCQPVFHRGSASCRPERVEPGTEYREMRQLPSGVFAPIRGRWMGIGQ